MVEVGPDGKRVYFINSLHGGIDDQLYPKGIEGWMAKFDARPACDIAFEPEFFIEWA